MRNMIRGIIDSVVEGAIKRLSCAGFSGETISDREYIQHYGFTSRPLAGAECIIIREGNHFIVIASDDRRYRLAIAAGEAALYDHQGQKVHLKEGKEIEISGCDKLTATAGVSATVTAPEITMTATTKVTMTTPLAEISGNLAVGGYIQAVGDIKDQGGTKTMAGMRTAYNSHTHAENGDGGGTTNAPNQEM